MPTFCSSPENRNIGIAAMSPLSGVPDSLPLEPEEAGDDGVLEERAVLLGRHREVPQRLRLRQRPRRRVVVRGELLGL